MYHSISEIQSIFGLQSAIFNSGSRPTSVNVGSVTNELGVVENVGLAIGISLITHSIPEIQSTSGLESAILN